MLSNIEIPATPRPKGHRSIVINGFYLQWQINNKY